MPTLIRLLSLTCLVQQEDSSEGDDDWDDEGVPQPAFNPTPMNLITDTGMPRQMSSAKVMFKMRHCTE